MAFILLADDDVEVHALVESALSLEGHNVMVANNGDEALSLIEANEFDLLILDYQMPGMTGIQAYREAKARDPKIPPAIILTIVKDVEIIQESLKAGVKDYVLKPFNTSVLALRVKKVLSTAP